MGATVLSDTNAVAWGRNVQLKDLKKRKKKKRKKKKKYENESSCLYFYSVRLLVCACRAVLAMIISFQFASIYKYLKHWEGFVWKNCLEVEINNDNTSESSTSSSMHDIFTRTVEPERLKQLGTMQLKLKTQSTKTKQSGICALRQQVNKFVNGVQSMHITIIISIN